MPPSTGSVCSPSDNRLGENSFPRGELVSHGLNRESTQIVRAVDTHKVASTFLAISATLGVSGVGVGYGQGLLRAGIRNGLDGDDGEAGQDNMG